MKQAREQWRGYDARRDIVSLAAVHTLTVPFCGAFSGAPIPRNTTHQMYL